MIDSGKINAAGSKLSDVDAMIPANNATPKIVTPAHNATPNVIRNVIPTPMLSRERIHEDPAPTHIGVLYMYYVYKIINAQYICNP